MYLYSINCYSTYLREWLQHTAQEVLHFYVPKFVEYRNVKMQYTMWCSVTFNIIVAIKYTGQIIASVSL